MLHSQPVVVFTIEQQTNPGLWVLFIAFAWAIMGGSVAAYMWKSGAVLRGAFAGCIAILGTVAVTLVGLSALSQHASIVRRHQRGESRVVEGKVSLRHAAPASGHDADELFLDSVRLEVRDNTLASGYGRPVANGGALRDGVHARLTLVDDVIVRVETFESAQETDD